MKILIIDSYYPNFLKQFWNKNQKLKHKSYKAKLNKLLGECFGTSDYYSYNLKKIGHVAKDIIANDEILQKTWAKENDFKYSSNIFLDILKTFPYIHRFIGKPTWVQEIVLAQLKKEKPDIIYVQDLSILNSETLKKAKKYCKLLVGQIASPLPQDKNLKEFDLILTSFPHYVKILREKGVKSEYFKIGFEKRLLGKIGKYKRKYDVSFVGSFTPYHLEASRTLESIAKKFRLHVWGHGLHYLSLFSPIKKNYHGEAWGKDMYKILAQSKIVINRHINVSENYANNMRLYETTGMGAMLITDKKSNLNSLFEIGREAVEYKDAQDLSKKIKYFINNSNERKKISIAGQKRTLNSHTYKIRMDELSNILNKYI